MISLHSFPAFCRCIVLMLAMQERGRKHASHDGGGGTFREFVGLVVAGQGPCFEVGNYHVVGEDHIVGFVWAQDGRGHAL